MPLYIDTLGYASCSIAVCDRCKIKMPYSVLMADKNAPGLRVCSACCDNLDPWRLPARLPENITLRFPRPDEGIDNSYTGAIAGLAIAGLAIAGSEL